MSTKLLLTQIETRLKYNSKKISIPDEKGQDRIFFECLVSAFVSTSVVSKLKQTIMKVQRELTMLNVLIKGTGVFNSIELLMKVLKDYQRLLKSKEHCYLIQQEFEIIQAKIYCLQEQLDWVIEQSEEWERSN